MQETGENRQSDEAVPPVAAEPSSTGWPGVQDIPSPTAERVAPWSAEHLDSGSGWVDTATAPDAGPYGVPAQPGPERTWPPDEPAGARPEPAVAGPAVPPWLLPNGTGRPAEPPVAAGPAEDGADRGPEGTEPPGPVAVEGDPYEDGAGDPTAERIEPTTGPPAPEGPAVVAGQPPAGYAPPPAEAYPGQAFPGPEGYAAYPPNGYAGAEQAPDGPPWWAQADPSAPPAGSAPTEAWSPAAWSYEQGWPAPPGESAPPAPGYAAPGYAAPGYAAPGYAAPDHPAPEYPAPEYPATAYPGGEYSQWAATGHPDAPPEATGPPAPTSAPDPAAAGGPSAPHPGYPGVAQHRPADPYVVSAPPPGGPPAPAPPPQGAAYPAPPPAPPRTEQPAEPYPQPRPPQPLALPPTAEEFAARRAHRPRPPEATMGVPALVRRLSFGMVHPHLSRKEVEYRDSVAKVRRNFGGLRQITVVNPKGGAGKTVAALMVAMTFGQNRGGYVLAWDNNETQGTLGMRSQQDFHTRTVRDVLHDLQTFMGTHGKVGDLTKYVRSQGEAMFDVLASDESATAGEMLTARAFADIREVVSRFYKLIIVDTGNNVRAENWQASIDATDQLVVTMSARGDSAETAARMLDHLEQTGRDQLVRQAVTVITMPASRKGVDLPAIQRHFAARTRAVIIVPYEALLDSGEPIRYGELSQRTRDAWLTIAAAIAEAL